MIEFYALIILFGKIKTNFTILSWTGFILLNAFIFYLNEADFLYLLTSLVGFNGINKKLQYMFGN